MALNQQQSLQNVSELLLLLLYICGINTYHRGMLMVKILYINIFMPQSKDQYASISFFFFCLYN